MALTDCLAIALAGGDITKAQHDRLASRFEQLRDRYAIDSASTAAERAKQALLDGLKADLAHRTRIAKLTIARQRVHAADLDAFRTADGRRDVASAALYKLENFGEAKFVSVAGQHKAVLAQAIGMMGSLIDRFGREFVTGRRKNVQLLDSVVREAFGEESGDQAAKAMAKAWLQTAEWLRQRFNAAGGAIGKLENWGMPQRHDPLALRKQGRATWKAAIAPMLDLAKMRHPLTDTPVLASELDGILDDIFDGITTDSWDTREPSAVPFGKGALANQRGEHRFLVFRSADDWLRYQRDWGGGSDPFTLMMDHLNMMSRDIGAMEILGPNPNGTVEWLKQTVRKAGAMKAAGKDAPIKGTGEQAANRARSREERIQNVWDDMRGALSKPVNSTMSKGVGGLRNLVTAASLGGAALSSTSDFGTARVTRMLAGVRGSVMRDYVHALTTMGRREAVDAGLMLEEGLQVLHAHARMAGALDGSGVTRQFADRVLEWSFLNAHTQAIKHATGLGFLREAALESGLGWDSLRPLWRRKLSEYGFTAADWDKLRSAPIHRTESGLGLLRAKEVAAIDPRLADRWLNLVQSETEYAVPSGSHRSRTLLLGNSKPGTLVGESLRSFAQFKSFSVAFAMMHGMRLYRMAVGQERGVAAAYLGGLVAVSFFYGALARQLKTMASGHDPEPMTDPGFWGASFLQAGGAGIYGDFLLADVNRFGDSLASTIVGPLAPRLGDFRDLTVGNLMQLGAGDETRFGRELVQFARQNVPGASIWWLRTALDRVVFDQVQHLLDPEANKAFKRKQHDFLREHRQGFWWAPGTAAPQRAPNLGNIAGATS